MKKQFVKIRIAAENLGRSNKHDRKDVELDLIEKQVDKYRDVLEKMVRKLPAVSTTTDSQEREKRVKKNSHYKIGQALEESATELSPEMPLHRVLANCGELEKSLADSIVKSELETENNVVNRLKRILDNEIHEISNLKRNLTRRLQEHASIARNYETAKRLGEPTAKIEQIKEQQEQCEVNLEKDRDLWAAKMFELIAKEDVIVDCIQEYVFNQRKYHEEALQRVNTSLAAIHDITKSTVKSRFGISLAEHLSSSHRDISYIIELCVCCLVENGLYEEGLLRVGCASTKLRRMMRALEAQHVKAPLPADYQDPHVIGSILKLYLRELPEPLLTYRLYKEFIYAVERDSEAERKAAIKTVLAKMPAANYANLRYLTRFLWLVTQNSVHNKMNSQNLAIVMSPNLLWQSVDLSNPDEYIGQVNNSSWVNVIVELLISQWDYFFEGEVDFYVTLQRDNLFAERKSKSGSSNEHLDKAEGGSVSSEHVSEVSRNGTIRRNKPCAPSPPAAKIFEKAQTQTPQHQQQGHLTISAPIQQTPEHHSEVGAQQQVSQSNGGLNHRAKELFPSVSNGQEAKDKPPEKPPLPSVLTKRDQQTQLPPQPVTPKPVPMTRTQFFGLENLPSPTADRKSNDSLGGFSMKPDVPQKPKVLKRPVALGLNRSDDESPPMTNQRDSFNGGSNNVRGVTEKFLDKMRTDQCDISTNSSSTLAAPPQQQQQRHSLILESNANVTAEAPAAASATNGTDANSMNGNAASASGDEAKSTAAGNVSTTIGVTANTLSAPSSTGAASNTDRNSLHENGFGGGGGHTRVPSSSGTTPVTPVSPSLVQTPKRPTVPAPPPPSMAKKQAE